MTVRLAAYGGEPVRTKPMAYGSPGAYVLNEAEKNEILEVLESRSLFRYYGPNMQYKVRQMEQEFGEFIGAPHVLGVTSGTAALVIALRALGVGPGDEVIVPAWTFIASPLAVVAAGAVPIFAEVDTSWNLDPADFERKITKRTKAVMPVHLVGVPCDMDGVMAVAKKHGIQVLEDVAQSNGAKYHGQYVGTIGDVGAFSLQLNKVITAGEGGIITTSDPIIIERAVRAHDQGNYARDFQGNTRDADGVSHVEEFCGENYRMNELTGAVALAQVRKLGELSQTVRGLSSMLRERLKDLDGVKFRHIPDPAGDISTGLDLEFVSQEQQELFCELVGAEGIPFAPMYRTKPVYLAPRLVNKRSWHPKAAPWHPSVYDGSAEYYEGLCPFTEELLKRHARIPTNPTWGEQEVSDVVEAVRKVWPEVVKAGK